MKTYSILGVAVVATLLLSGCTTVFNGSAPAQEGSLYVVGQKAGFAQTWICPSAPHKGDCQEVAVEVTRK